MRENVQAFVSSVAQAFELREPVYAFTSRRGDDPDFDDEGELLRRLLPGKSVTRSDIRLGTSLGRGERLAVSRLATSSADVVFCLDALEHVFDVPRTIDELLRVLRPGGLLVITTAAEAPVDLHPGDYWRLTPSCLAQLLTPLDATVVGHQGTNAAPHTLLAVGCKEPVPATFAAGVGPLIETFETRLHQLARTTPVLHTLRDFSTFWLRGRAGWRELRDRHRAQFAVHVPLAEHWKQHAVANPYFTKSSGTRLDRSSS